MHKDIEINTKGMKVKASFELNGETLIINTQIKRWFRRLEYSLEFSEPLVDVIASLNKLTDFNNWIPLEENKIHKIENLAWKSLGFNRLYRLKEKPELKGLKSFHQISLLGLQQASSRRNTVVSGAWIGQRQNHQFLMMHIGHYFSGGISNMSGSSPTTMIFPLEIIQSASSKYLLKTKLSET